MTPRILTREFSLTTLANSVFFVGMTMSFVLPVQLEELGASRSEIGHIVGTFGFASLIAIPATGALADRFGRRPFMLIGATLFLLVALGFSTLDRVGPAFYLLRLAQGLAFSMAFVSTNALIVDLAPPGALGRAIAIFGTATLLTHALGPSLGEWVAHRFGFPTMWRIAAGTSAVALVMFATLRMRARGQRDASQPDLGMLALTLRRGSIGPLLAGIATAMAFGTAIHFIPIYVRERGLASHTPFFASYVASAIFVRLVAGGLGDRLGHKRVATGAVIGFALAVVSFAFVKSSLSLALTSLCFGTAHGWAYPSMNALFVEDAPAASRGRAMAVFNLAFNVGITIAAFAAGEVAERLSYGAMWLSMGLIAGLGAVALAVDRPPLRASADRA